MESNTLSVALSLAGLVLGFVAAYGQIRTFLAKLFSFSANAAKRWGKRRSERIEVFANHPSALLAEVTSTILLVLFLIILSAVTLSIFKQHFPDIPKFVRETISFLIGMVAGGKIGALTLLVNDVKERIFGPGSTSG